MRSIFPHCLGWRRCQTIADKQTDILARRDQPILRLLECQAAPPGSLQSVIVGSISETTFHQMSPPLAITTCRIAARLAPGHFDPIMVRMSLDSPSTNFRSGALWT